MATGLISSTFDIQLTADANPDFNVAKSWTVSRGFRLVGITIQNSANAAGTLTVTRTTTSDGVAAAGVVMTALADGTTAGAAPYAVNAAGAGQTGCSQTLPVAAANAIVPDPVQSGTTLALGSTATVSTVLSVLDSAAQLVTITLHCIAADGEAITVA